MLKNMKNWLKNKLRCWLEIDRLEYSIDKIAQQLGEATATALDVHYKSNSIIIVASRLQGGNVRIVDADFDNLKHLREWVKHAIPRSAFYAEDMPPFHRNFR